MIKMPINEIADRYSICLLKSERTDENMNEELNLYKYTLENYDGIDKYVQELVEINGSIWDLESDIRKGRENELGLEEVGRRAILIRDTNKKRITIKNKIVDKYGEGFRDIKINHGSD